MGKTHESQIVLQRIATVAVKMSDLATLFGEVAVQVKTESASSGTLRENSSFNIGRDRFSRRLRHENKVLPGQLHPKVYVTPPRALVAADANPPALSLAASASPRRRHAELPCGGRDRVHAAFSLVSRVSSVLRMVLPLLPPRDP
jgi:hypothetical protein